MKHSRAGAAGDKPFLWSNSYSFDRSSLNLEWLTRSATTTHMPILVKRSWVGSSLWSLCDFLWCSLFSSWRQSEYSRRICTHKVSQRCAFWRFRQENFIPSLISTNSYNPKILHTKSRISLKVSIYLGGSATKIRIRIANSLREFQIWGQNLPEVEFWPFLPGPD